MSGAAETLQLLVSYPLALAGLGAGLVAGFGLVFATERKKLQGAVPTARVDLLAQRESLYAQLRELDDTRDKLDASLYASERAKLLGAAAAVLRALDADAPAEDPAQAEPAVAPEAPRSWARRNPQLAGALWMAGALGFGAVVYTGLDRYATTRAEGQGLTGGNGMGPASAPNPVAAELAALKAAAEANPQDVAALNAYGHALIATDSVMEAWKLAEAAVAIDPANSEARVHQAVTLLRIGDSAMAAQVLDRVISVDPKHAEALGYRGALYASEGNKEAAVKAWTAAAEGNPAEAEVFRQMIAQVDQILASARSAKAAAAGAGAPGAGAPGAGAPEATASADAVEFTGEVRLADGVENTGGVLYIYVRPAGVEGGPPSRVKRLGPEFPATFSISAADSPMGGSLSGPVVISARLDPDGNAMTKEPDAPAAKSAPLEAGATGIVLTLQK